MLQSQEVHQSISTTVSLGQRHKPPQEEQYLKPSRNKVAPPEGCYALQGELWPAGTGQEQPMKSKALGSYLHEKGRSSAGSHRQCWSFCSQQRKHHFWCTCKQPFQKHSRQLSWTTEQIILYYGCLKKYKKPEVLVDAD